MTKGSASIWTDFRYVCAVIGLDIRHIELGYGYARKLAAPTMRMNRGVGCR